MPEYYIRIKEEFYKSDVTGDIRSRTVWEVESEDCHIDSGVINYGGPVGETEARKAAEKAATLDAKQEAAKAKVITYDFTPEI